MVNYWGCIKWKETKAALAKQAPEQHRRAPSQATLSHRKFSGPCPLPSRWTWARVGNTSSEGSVSSRLPPIDPESKSPNSLK